jgi:hypothetical protein
MALQMQRLSAAEKRIVAREVSAEIQRRGVTEGRSTVDVHRAMVRMNVLLSEFMVAGVSDISTAAHIAPDQFGTLMPIILAGTATPQPERARQIAHELAHELMREWVAPALYDTDAVICTAQDNRRVRHEIARQVEEMVDAAEQSDTRITE